MDHPSNISTNAGFKSGPVGCGKYTKMLTVNRHKVMTIADMGLHDITEVVLTTYKPNPLTITYLNTSISFGRNINL